jgi:hypothetical protein
MIKAWHRSAIKTLRKKQPIISKISASLLRKHYPILSEEAAKLLAAPFNRGA